MTKRRFVLTGAVGLLGLGALGYGGSLAVCSLGREQTALLRPLLVALDGMRTPERIGQAWLRQEGPETIAERLLAQDVLVKAALLPDTLATKSQIDGAIRKEFARGDVVVADRWVVSRTEARLAALWLAM